MGKHSSVARIKSGAVVVPIYYYPSKQSYRARWVESGKRQAPRGVYDMFRPGVVSFLVPTRFDTFRTSHSRASAYGSLHESPSSVSTVLVPHRSVPSRQAHGWPLWCDIVRGGRPLCSYAVARRWHPIQGPMAHALSTVFDSSGPSLKHGGRCAHRTQGYHH